MRLDLYALRRRSWAEEPVSSPEGLELLWCSSPEKAVPNELCLHWTTETTFLLPAGLKDCACFPPFSHAQWNHTGIWGHKECAVLILKTQREHSLKAQWTCNRTKEKEVWGNGKSSRFQVQPRPRSMCPGPAHSLAQGLLNDPNGTALCGRESISLL